MALFYVDISAIIKRYQREKGTEVVDQLFDNLLREDRFYTSFLSVLELTSGIMRLAKGGQLQENNANELIARFREDLRQRFQVWPLDNAITSKAVSIVEQHKLRSADAIHTATAFAIFSVISGQDSVLVSSDHEMLEAAEASQLATIYPQEANSLDKLFQLRQDKI